MSWHILIVVGLYFGYSFITYTYLYGALASSTFFKFLLNTPGSFEFYLPFADL
jgi:hypothetical protein